MIYLKHLWDENLLNLHYWHLKRELEFDFTEKFGKIASLRTEKFVKSKSHLINEDPFGIHNNINKIPMKMHLGLMGPKLNSSNRKSLKTRNFQSYQMSSKQSAPEPLAPGRENWDLISWGKSNVY